MTELEKKVYRDYLESLRTHILKEKLKPLKRVFMKWQKVMNAKPFDFILNLSNKTLNEYCLMKGQIDVLENILLYRSDFGKGIVLEIYEYNQKAKV